MYTTYRLMYTKCRKSINTMCGTLICDVGLVACGLWLVACCDLCVRYDIHIIYGEKIVMIIWQFIGYFAVFH